MEIEFNGFFLHILWYKLKNVSMDTGSMCTWFAISNVQLYQLSTISTEMQLSNIYRIRHGSRYFIVTKQLPLFP
jgi:hypothetical protein